ncbi:hypothetical protein [uncultured Roseobacter sp.]|uniref:hypothetical protein n=1 Tax=uncultured Roseobacter sp. TaxID=114847 RepID=UPI00262CC9C3|nr:hypothetical protein [uncultured Roseobacter sp.]
MSTLDAQLIAAHEQNDTETLVRLYARAAEHADDEDAAGFYLTHAYVFALESGHPDVPGLRARLIALGRETALQDPADN